MVDREVDHILFPGGAGAGHDDERSDAASDERGSGGSKCIARWLTRSEKRPSKAGAEVARPAHVALTFWSQALPMSSWDSHGVGGLLASMCSRSRIPRAPERAGCGQMVLHRRTHLASDRVHHPVDCARPTEGAREGRGGSSAGAMSLLQ